MVPSADKTTGRGVRGGFVAAFAPLAAWCVVVSIAIAADAMWGAGQPTSLLAIVVLGVLMLATRARWRAEQNPQASGSGATGSSASSSMSSPEPLVMAWVLAATAAAFTMGAAPATAAWFVAPILMAGGFGAARGLMESVGLSGVGLAGVLAMTALGYVGAGWTGDWPAWIALIAGAPALAWMAGRAMDERERMGRESEGRVSRLRAALANLPDLVLHVSPDEQIVGVYGVGEGLEWPPEEFRGRQLGDLAPIDALSRLRRAITDARRDGTRSQGQSEIAGAPTSWAVAAGPSGDVVLVLRDARAQRAREVELVEDREEAQAQLRRRSLFFAGLGHELRTPLNAVIGFSDAMRMRLFGPLSGRYGEYADLIHESAELLLELIGDVLDVSKIEAGRYDLQMSEFDAREAVTAAGRLVSERARVKGVAFHVDVGGVALPVEADARALKQILLNLLSNAIKFTPQGGQVRLRATRHGADLVMEVEDTGAGMAADELARLGAAFEQTASAHQSEERGSGLGVMLVRRLTELHGGVFSPHSELGRGTVMRVHLPVMASRQSAARFDARAQLDQVRRATGGDDS